MFQVRVTVRGYELDTQGHLAGANYLRYSEHARWELLRAAGLSIDDLLAAGVGPVTLEATIRFQQELRGGQEVDVSCAFLWGEGKTFRVAQQIRLPDGVVAAEVGSVGGLLDLGTRHLVTNPGGRFRLLARNAALLGL